MAHRSSIASSGGPPLAVVIPALGGLVVLGMLIGFIGGDDASATPSIQPTPTPMAVVVGDAAGSAWPVATASPTVSPAATPSAEETPTPTDKPAKKQRGGSFSADVAVCRSVSNARCVGSFETLPDGTSSFWFLIDFDGARAGDVLQTRLRGPGGGLNTPDFHLNGGERHAWGQIAARSLRPGEYTLGVDYNGKRAAETTFSIR
jgi:hypothetical protein